MPANEQLLHNPEPLDHFVQLYEADEQLLARNVARYFQAGLERGEPGLAVATPEHSAAILWELRRLDVDVEAAQRDSRLRVLDAGRMLARFIVAGFPDATRFEATIGTAVRDSIQAAAGRPLRAYGDMAGVLWEARQFPAAIRVEQLWHKLRKSACFTLFCGYPIDVFTQLDIDLLDPLLCAHTHLLSSGGDGHLETALQHALDDVLGSEFNSVAPTLRGKLRSAWAQLPQAEATILWLRKNAPDRAEAVLASARRHYRALA
jgi:hypothetical protein